MNYKNLYRDVELYLNMEGADARYHIKSFINDAIIDFVRLYNWQFSMVKETVQLDGSGLFSLSNLENRFAGEINLFVGSNLYTKLDFSIYNQSPSPSGYYSLFGNDLYIGGDSEIDFIYKTTGYKYTEFNITGFSGNGFVIAGNQTEYFREKTSIGIRRSTANDSIYTIVSVNYTTDTIIEVSEIIPDLITIDGVVAIERSNILEFDTDEVVITEHYSDVIKHLTALKMLYYLGDMEEYRKEENLTLFKVQGLKKHENRMNKEGMLKVIAR